MPSKQPFWEAPASRWMALLAWLRAKLVANVVISSRKHAIAYQLRKHNFLLPELTPHAMPQMNATLIVVRILYRSAS